MCFKYEMGEIYAVFIPLHGANGGENNFGKKYQNWEARPKEGLCYLLKIQQMVLVFHTERTQ